MKKIIISAILLCSLTAFQTFSADDAVQGGSDRLANSFNYPVTNRDFIMQHVQSKLDYAKFIVFDLDNISKLNDISPAQKKQLSTVYIIVAKTGDIVSSPSEVTESKVYNRVQATKEDFNEQQEVTKVIPDGKDIANMTISAWQQDETRIVYDIGGYFTTVAVTKDRELIIIAIPDIYAN